MHCHAHARDYPHPQRPFVEGSVVYKLGPHDVLLGRGGGTNNYRGNVKFRKLVSEHKMRYLAVSKVEKPNVAREVVAIWRKLNPPGRFLTKQEDLNKKSKDSKEQRGSKPSPARICDTKPQTVWVEVGDKKAREKASQCLRERPSNILPFVRELKEQQQQTGAGTKAPNEGKTPPPLCITNNDNPKNRHTEYSKACSTRSTPEGADTVTEATASSQSSTGNPKVRARTEGPGRCPKASKAARLDGKKQQQQQSFQEDNGTFLGHHHNHPSVAEHAIDMRTMGVGNLTPPRELNKATNMDIHSMGMNPAGNLQQDSYQDGMSTAAAPMDSIHGAILARRNSTPADCSPHHPSVFMNRRGSLPTSMTASSAGMSMNMENPAGAVGMASFSPNANALLQNMQAMGKAPLGVVTNGMGFFGESGVFGACAGNDDLSCTGAMPGGSQMTHMEAAPPHNGAPSIQYHDSMQTYQQQQLRLQQLQLEQQRLHQKQLETQIQLQMELHLHQTRYQNTSMGHYPGIHQHNGLPPQHVIMNGREVAAQGFLPLSSRERGPMETLPIQRQEQQASRNGDENESASPSFQQQEPGHHHMLRSSTDPPTVEPRFDTTSPTADMEGDGASREGFKHDAPAQISPDTPRGVVPSNMPREQEKLPHIPRDGLRDGTSSSSSAAIPSTATTAFAVPPPPKDSHSDADPNGEMTLAEYRKTLDAYVATNNIAMDDYRVYSDHERDDADHNCMVNDDILSVKSFGEWRDAPYRGSPTSAGSRSATSPQTNINGKSSGGMRVEARNGDDAPRPDPPERAIAAGRALPHIKRGHHQQQSGSRSSSLRSSFASLSGMSLLSSNGDDDRGAGDDCGSTTGKGGPVKNNFSSNESIVSEITVLSHTMDDLGLGDDE